MNHDLKQLVKKAGLPPGTIRTGGAKGPVSISHMVYHRDGLETKLINQVSDIQFVAQQKNWVDVMGIDDADVMLNMGKKFQLHPLILEDICNTAQLPKCDEHDDAFFMMVKAISFNDSEISFEHIAFYMRENLMLSFQEHTTDTFHVVKQRMQDKLGKITKKNVDYLLYALLDYVIDTYFVVLRKIDAQVTLLNQEVDENPNSSTLKNIQSLKKQVLLLKRYFWYIRDIILALKKTDSPLFSKKTQKYLVDCHDHIAHIIDISESFREELIDLTERHLSAINMRSNDIMKILTIVAAIFMPLTFLVGIYGMNFKAMPELDWPWGYPVLMGSMVVLSVGLLVFFKRKKWLD
ncbi:MAG: magnesium/cobalt transporter CorA [Candidatus Margulisbacteria bacterium]|nr:magnesium/cobalt transporter CorA [Candidatus Margulisiibacteriota bacterium]